MIGTKLNIEFTIVEIAKEGDKTNDGTVIESNKRGNLWWAVPSCGPEFPRIIVCRDQVQDPQPKK